MVDVLASAGINQPQALILGSLFGTEQGVLRDPKREQAIKESGVPYTIVRAGKIKNLPGASMQLEISQHDQQASGDIRCCSWLLVLLQSTSRLYVAATAVSVVGYQLGMAK